jgi:hypothetical protein
MALTETNQAPRHDSLKRALEALLRETGLIPGVRIPGGLLVWRFELLPTLGSVFGKVARAIVGRPLQRGSAPRRMFELIRAHGNAGVGVQR